MSKDKTKIDKAWRKIIDRTQILEQIRDQGHSVVDAAELKEKSDKEEPRLLAKIDFSRSRPKVFVEHGLNILPISRGSYVIFDDYQNSCYKNLPEQEETDAPAVYRSQIRFGELDTIRKDKKWCSSESEVLEFAYLSSLISTFCNVDNLVSTRSGRFGSNTFDLELPNSRKTSVEIQKAQIEVDGIYENQDAVVLVEVKRCISDDINVRQIYYPYIWAKSVTQKKIVSILLGYSNGVFRITEFDCDNTIEKVEVVRQEFFLIDEEHAADININTILKYSSTPKEVYSVPYPQADTMDKVIDVFIAMSQGIDDKDDLSLLFDFDVRQSDYHKNAVKYLGLINTDGEITRVGSRLLNENFRSNRTEIIFSCMMARPSLRASFLLLQSRDYRLGEVDIREIAEIISKSGHTITGSTLTRRAQTVKAWLRWLVANLKGLER